ncbi:MAG: immune inhibitor A [Chloroflexi bacterium]|nr:immune inhibitor A [Chloroflexota bacterium]
MSRNGWIAVITGLVVACLCLSVCGGAILVSMVFIRSMNGTSIELPAVVTTVPRRLPGATNTPRPLQRGPLPTATVVSPTGDVTTTKVLPATVTSDTLESALSTVLPRENLADLAIRFKGVSPEQTTISCTVESKGYDVGDTRQFVLSNQDDNSQFTVTAELRYETEYVYMWVERSPDRINLSTTALRRAGDEFTEKILTTNREFFGDEARPGVDCDPHLYILHASGVGSTVGGYFSSPDGYLRAVRADSNEAEMFVVNAEPGYNGSDPGSSGYMSTLAHELQHMISYNQVHAPSLWLEEGAAQLAERLNGYGDEVGTVYSFANAPETQLNTWAESSAGENSAHYGAGYLFWSYLYDRFGADVVKALAHTKERGIPSFMTTLADSGITDPDTGQPYRFEDLFADFVIANYMGQQKLDDAGTSNRYNYTQTDVPPMSAYADLNATDYPYETHDQVNQFGTHYIELQGNAPVSISFTGSTIVPLLLADNADGMFWWSNRADASNPRLTREVDLSEVSSATLRYRAWYRIEEGYDYAYASVSTDQGETWNILQTTSCVTTNPNGANLGCGYNGSSGGSGTPQWVDEQADLSEYAGKQVLLRFELVTDAGVNREGLAVDNIEIPEIGFKDDGNADAAWNSEGFMRVDNILPQYWSVQLIVANQDGSVSLQRMPLTDNAGGMTVDFGTRSEGEGKVRRAVLAISATTQVTTEPGVYELRLTQ